MTPREAPDLGGRAQGQLDRALVEQTVGVVRDQQRRQVALWAGHSGEYDQQVEVAISGRATSTPGYADIPVSWEHPFAFAPLQRDPQFPRPHVSSHIEFTGTAAFVVGWVHVVKWLQSDEGWYIGATVRVAVMAPSDTAAVVAFVGNVHLTFQGWAAPLDPEEDDAT